MKFSVYLPDETIAAVRAQAAAAGITRAEFIRRAVVAACTPHDTPDTRHDTPHETPTAALRDAIADADTLRSALATVTVERDQARADLATLDRRAAIAEAIAAERAEHIANLLRSLAAVEGMARRALPPPADGDQAPPGLLDRFRSWLHW